MQDGYIHESERRDQQPAHHAPHGSLHCPREAALQTAVEAGEARRELMTEDQEGPSEDRASNTMMITDSMHLPGWRDSMMSNAGAIGAGHSSNHNGSSSSYSRFEALVPQRPAPLAHYYTHQQDQHARTGAGSPPPRFAGGSAAPGVVPALLQIQPPTSNGSSNSSGWYGKDVIAVNGYPASALYTSYPPSLGRGAENALSHNQHAGHHYRSSHQQEAFSPNSSSAEAHGSFPASYPSSMLPTGLRGASSAATARSPSIDFGAPTFSNGSSGRYYHPASPVGSSSAVSSNFARWNGVHSGHGESVTSPLLSSGGSQRGSVSSSATTLPSASYQLSSASSSFPGGLSASVPSIEPALASPTEDGRRLVNDARIQEMAEQTAHLTVDERRKRDAQVLAAMRARSRPGEESEAACDFCRKRKIKVSS